MKNLAILAVIAFLLAFGVSEHQKTIKLTRETILLQQEVVHLRLLKAHFYDFRSRVMSTIPMDYLSKVTIDDFDFDKYEEGE